MTAMFLHNFDALVTRDYLDTRFSEFEARIDKRFARVDVKLARMNITLGLVLVAVAVPALQALAAWV